MGDDAARHTIEGLFEGHPDGLAICRAVEAAALALGPAQVRVTKSQVTFARRRGFAFVWRPGQYVRSDVPAVLSIALPRAVTSSRIKEVVHPSGRVWVHHLELWAPTEVDDEVDSWLAEAYDSAA